MKLWNSQWSCRDFCRPNKRGFCNEIADINWYSSCSKVGLLIAYSSKVLIYFTSISTDFSQVEEKNPAGTKEDGMGNAVERCFMFLFLLASLLRLTKTNMTRNEDVTSNKLLEGERDQIAQGSRCLLGGGHVQSVLSARAIRNYPPLGRTLAFHRFVKIQSYPKHQYSTGGWFPAHLKKMLIKLDHFPNFRGEIFKMKPLPNQELEVFGLKTPFHLNWL